MHRASIGGVFVGLIVALAIGALLAGVAAATWLSLGPEVDPYPALVCFGLLAYAIIAFIGGRVAASDGRAVVRRDGVHMGIVLWAALTLAVSAIAGGWLAWATYTGRVDLAAWIARRQALVPGAWGLLAAHVMTFAAAIWGGISGARAEATAIGLRDIYPPDYDVVEESVPEHIVDDDPDRYERNFFSRA